MRDLLGNVFDAMENGPRAESVINRCLLMAAEKGDRAMDHIIDPKVVREYVKRLRGGIHDAAKENAKKARIAAIHQAEIVVIDTTLDDFENYFWLGLCHGLQKEVIPFSVRDERVEERKLPFDIRTLWHVSGSFADGQGLQRQLTQILTEVVAKRLYQRTIVDRESFWRPIVHASKVSLYLGTEKSQQLPSKQVMGEWDLRTSQEITALVQRMNPSVDVRVEKPAFRRQAYGSKDISGFRRLLKDRIGGAHCVVIGTPDVNPVAEMVLAELKDVAPFQPLLDVKDARPEAFRGAVPAQLRNTYISFKYHLLDYYNPGPTTFFHQFPNKEPKRGFLYCDADGECLPAKPYIEDYIPREMFKPDEKKRNFRDWFLLGHLVVAPNPFAEGFPNTPLRALLLMGNGGPATLGLAHLLTGSLPERRYAVWTSENERAFMRASDEFLKGLNQLLLRHHAAEAIVRIQVKNDLASLNNAYEDSREIVRVEVAKSLEGVENPKPFPFAAARGARPAKAPFGPPAPQFGKRSRRSAMR